MSRLMPYQPMHKPREVSQERMREILSKRTNGWPTATARPEILTRPKGALQWQRPEPGATGVRTVCEWYSCCKVMLDGKWVYEVWKREPLTSGMKQLACGLASFDEGKRVAQADADKAAA
jgi:hypothetical protein